MNRDRPSLDVRESPSLRLPQMMNRLATLHCQWHISICVATSTTVISSSMADSYLQVIHIATPPDIYSTHDAIVARAPRPY